MEGSGLEAGAEVEVGGVLRGIFRRKQRLFESEVVGCHEPALGGPRLDETGPELMPGPLPERPRTVMPLWGRGWVEPVAFGGF